MGHSVTVPRLREFGIGHYPDMKLTLELTDAQYALLERMLRAHVGWTSDRTRNSADAEDILCALRDAHAEALRKAPA